MHNLVVNLFQGIGTALILPLVVLVIIKIVVNFLQTK